MSLPPRVPRSLKMSREGVFRAHHHSERGRRGSSDVRATSSGPYPLTLAPPPTGETTLGRVIFVSAIPWAASEAESDIRAHDGALLFQVAS